MDVLQLRYGILVFHVDLSLESYRVFVENGSVWS